MKIARLSHIGLIRYSLMGLLTLSQAAMAGPNPGPNQRYVFKDSDLGNQDTFYRPVMDFSPGDEIVIQNGDQPVQTFKLGQLLGEGTAGRVFQLEETPTPSVVKFQFGTARARQMMVDELRAFEMLKRERISHTKVMDSDPRFYIIKEFVQGHTLEEIANTVWDQLDPEDQTDMIQALVRTIESLKNSSWSFSDVGGENIMFDLEQKVWRIVDSGTAKRVCGKSGSTEDLEIAVEMNDDMYQSLEQARKNRSRLRRKCPDSTASLNKRTRL